MYAELKIDLDKITSDLAKTDGVNGSLIVDINGKVLSHHLLQDLDIDLFGPMSNVITGSSERLINVSNHGKIERVLVESEKGKALFLHLGNVHFIVLMENDANVGMVMIASKRAAREIIELTKDLTIVHLEEQVVEEEINETEVVEEKVAEPVREVTQPELVEEITESVQETTKLESIPESVEAATEEGVKPVPTQEEALTAPLSEEIATEPVTEELTKPVTEKPEASAEEEPVQKEPEVSIPVIKPPIAFPKLEKVTEIPEDGEARVDLLLKIYESLFLAMSIGASKIMGVAPARGLTRKFLPVEDCKILLDGVDVKNNSSIDFVKIKENADKIPLADREKVFKESFGKIITIITENYGKVMGYAAFKGMIRPEFKIINESYGPLLDGLGIKEQLHPELLDFFN